MLFKHEAPVTNRVKKRLFERPSVNAEPVLEQNYSVERIDLAVQLLVGVNLLHSYTTTTTQLDYANTAQRRIQDLGSRIRQGVCGWKSSRGCV